ncbi:MAG: hypothetical protein JO107_02840 [Hyphomicrobiales bacterium]|nr:hypothetical protein [Hyphomicrobiales bacterium]MBV8662018.1 hypothetical protein [Hyphomicrobiales bacterium]
MLKPLTPSRDTSTVHMILVDYGRRNLAYPETQAIFTEANAVEEIESGAHDKVLAIHAFNVSEGFARDVTEDIARLLFARWEPSERPNMCMCDLFEKSGLDWVGSMREAREEAAEVARHERGFAPVLATHV